MTGIVGIKRGWLSPEAGLPMLWVRLFSGVQRWAMLIQQEKSWNKGEFRHLAIANPKLAPYGKAAQEVLHARKVWVTSQGNIVRETDWADFPVR